MATIIPDRCPGKATEGERLLFGLLRDRLPADYRVWYEAEVSSRYPDFTVFGPSFGLVVLEAKGWYAGQMTRVTDSEVDLRITREGSSHIERHEHPLRQARDYMFGVMGLLAREPLLRQAGGAHEGKLCFPCAYAAVLTNVTREQLIKGGLSPVFDPDLTICKDELEEAAAKQGDALARLLRKCFKRLFPFATLTADQAATVQGTLYKEVVVASRPATARSVPEGVPLPGGSRALAVLDRDQELIARSLGDGHRLLCGVAGSGKTVILLARARLLAGRDPQQRILVLCYNRSLAAYLDAQIQLERSHPNIEVRTFTSWAAQTTQLWWEKAKESFEGYENRLSAALLQQTGRWAPEQKYAAVFIDEGHDFEPEWLVCCANAVRGGAEGDLLIAVDGAQSLYGRPRSFTWKSVNVHVQGRVRKLQTTYRNTKEVMALAWHLTQGRQEVADTEVHVRLLPMKAVRLGPRPGYQGHATSQAEHAAIVEAVRGHIGRGTPPHDICVLYPRNEDRRIHGLHEALRTTGDVCWITNDEDRRAKTDFVRRPGVRLCTIHSAKGMQFPVVIFSSLDQLPDPRSDVEQGDLNLLYVGLTRSMEHLLLTWAGRSSFTERVEGSKHADRLLPAPAGR